MSTTCMRSTPDITLLMNATLSPWHLFFNINVLRAVNIYSDSAIRLDQFAGLIFPLINPLNANPTKWSNTIKQFVGNLPTNCLSVFVHFVALALKGLIKEALPNDIFCNELTLFTGKNAILTNLKQARTNWAPDADSLARKFCLKKKKNSFDLQISSQIDKAMQKLQGIPNTILSTSVLGIFCCLHIW